jgi:hypothetical protein
MFTCEPISLTGLTNGKQCAVNPFGQPTRGHHFLFQSMC